MAKIGTAHVEIKPVLSEDALEAITERIADAIAQGVERGMSAARPRMVFGDVHITSEAATRSAADAEVIATAIRNRTEHYETRH